MPRPHHILCDNRGLTSVEFALVAALFLFIVLAIVDFARVLWHWNAAAKATQAGARFAATHDIVAVDFRNFRGLSHGLRSGAEIPLGTVGMVSIACDSSGCAGDPAKQDALAFADLVGRLRRFDSGISADNVIVEYRHIGHGFVGNPLGPDLAPAVTVRLRGRTVPFIVPGLAGVVSLFMPEFATTLTGEDASTP